MIVIQLIVILLSSCLLFSEVIPEPEMIKKAEAVIKKTEAVIKKEETEFKTNRYQKFLEKKFSIGGHFHPLNYGLSFKGGIGDVDIEITGWVPSKERSFYDIRIVYRLHNLYKKLNEIYEENTIHMLPYAGFGYGKNDYKSKKVKDSISRFDTSLSEKHYQFLSGIFGVYIIYGKFPGFFHLEISTAYQHFSGKDWAPLPVDSKKGGKIHYSIGYHIDF